MREKKCIDLNSNVMNFELKNEAKERKRKRERSKEKSETKRKTNTSDELISEFSGSTKRSTDNLFTHIKI